MNQKIMIVENHYKTRPYTLPPIRGQVGRSGKQKYYVTDRHGKLLSRVSATKNLLSLASNGTTFSGAPN